MTVVVLWLHFLPGEDLLLPGEPPLSDHHQVQSTGPASPGNSPASYQLSGS